MTVSLAVTLSFFFGIILGRNTTKVSAMFRISGALGTAMGVMLILSIYALFVPPFFGVTQPTVIITEAFFCLLAFIAAFLLTKSINPWF